MNLPTLALIAVIATLVAVAVRRIRREKLLGSCGGDCSSCAGACKYRRQNDK